MKILIAEDDVDQAEMLDEILKEAGYETVVTYDGAMALEKLKQERFDLLITDWMMPKMNGIELIESVNQVINPRPFIIMATALQLQSSRKQAFASGADAYFVKPYDSLELLEEIKVWEDIIMGKAL